MKQLKSIVSQVLVLSMICTLFGQHLSGTVAKAANTTSHTIELKGTSDLLLSNATASSGRVTMTYTVESVSTGTTNNGVVATKNATGSNPYQAGDMYYHNQKNRMLEEGRTYTIELSVGDDGYVAWECSWTNKSVGTSGSSVDLPHHTKGTATEAQYFGIYVASSTTAKLTNVTCVDAGGNDLGLQVNTKNSDKCTITMDVQNEKTTSYTVELNGTTDLLLSNAKASNGPVILTYMVESLTATTGNNGVVATNRPLGANPYTVSGNMHFHHATNRMLVEGRTYAIELSVGNNGKVAWECNWKDADKTGNGITFTQYTDALATGSQYFGIYISGNTTAKLINVTCVDADGNNLGLQVNTKNSDKCSIKENMDESLRDYTRLSFRDYRKTSDGAKLDSEEGIVASTDIVAFTNSVDNLNHVGFTGTVKFTQTGIASQSLRIGGQSDTGIGLYLSGENLYARNYSTGIDVNLGNGFGVNEEITVSLFFTLTAEDIWTVEYYVNGSYVTTARYTQTANFGNNIVIGNGMTFVSAGEFNPVEEQTLVSYDLDVDGAYLIAGDCVVTDSTGDEIIVGTDNPILSDAGDYTILTTNGSFQYSKRVSLYRMGDVDLDGTVGQAGDLAKLQALLDAGEGTDVTISSAEYAADLDNDGKVGEKDLILMEDITNSNTTLDAVLKKYHVAALSFDYIGGGEVMPIVGYYGPYSRGKFNFLTDEIYKSIKECGFNLINYSFNGMGEGNSALAYKAMSLAEKYGIGYFVEDFRLNPEYDISKSPDTAPITASGSLTMQELTEFIGDYAYFESYLGQFVVDEPFPYQVYQVPTRELVYFDWTFNTTNKYANTVGYINAHGAGSAKIYPGYTTTTTYKGFLQTIADLGARVLSFDSYPFASEGKTLDNQQNYFTSLWQIRAVAQKNNIPFWSYVQAGGDFTTESRATNEGALPSETEIYWNVNTSLAFGAKGIEYFTLVQAYSLANSEEGSYDSDRNGLIGVDGEETPYYEYAKKINAHVGAIDEVLMKAESTGIMATGSTTQRVLRESGVDLLNDTNKLQSVTAENETYGALVGCFDYRDTEAFYVVNYNTEACDTITLNFKSEQDARIIQDGVTTYGTGTSVTLTISGGEAVLVVLEDRVIEVSEISGYRGNTYSAPDAEPGYVFAGWFLDVNCTQPVSADTKSGKAYAKFVDETVLSVKAQITKGTTANSPFTSIRFVTTVDTLGYHKVGFEINANGVTKCYGSTKVYMQLYGVDSGDVMIEYKPDKEFSTISQYFKACTIGSISNRYFDTEWTVRAYWNTLDGTTVYGEPSVKVITMGLEDDL